jgi:hypothetical protein
VNDECKPMRCEEAGVRCEKRLAGMRGDWLEFPRKEIKIVRMSSVTAKLRERETEQDRQQRRRE